MGGDEIRVSGRKGKGNDDERMKTSKRGRGKTEKEKQSSVRLGLRGGERSGEPYMGRKKAVGSRVLTFFSGKDIPKPTEGQGGKGPDA